MFKGITRIYFSKNNTQLTNKKKNLMHWFYTKRSKLSTNKDEKLFQEQTHIVLAVCPLRRFITAVADESSMGLHML